MPSPLPYLLVCATIGCTAIAGCSNEPELNNLLTPDLRDTDYPTLLPIEDLTPLLPAPEAESAKLEKSLKARSNSLERRADALRRSTN